jgi:GAF domain-containing protein
VVTIAQFYYKGSCYGLGKVISAANMAVNQSTNVEARDYATESMSVLAAHAAEQAREMLHAGVTGDEILTMLVNAAEHVAGDSSVCSILVLDKEGLLRNAASPNLPADYLAAIDRLKPNPGVGTCSAAAATGSVVVTRDFQADDKWAELRHLPLSLGFKGAWSMPIKTADGTVLGTLGTYFRERRSPTPEELKSVDVLAAAAGLVLAGQDKRT